MSHPDMGCAFAANSLNDGAKSMSVGEESAKTSQNCFLRNSPLYRTPPKGMLFIGRPVLTVTRLILRV